jgi:hypothetical protein
MVLLVVAAGSGLFKPTLAPNEWNIIAVTTAIYLVAGECIPLPIELNKSTRLTASMAKISDIIMLKDTSEGTPGL